MKITTLIIISFGLFFLSFTSVQAQSNTVRTRVGNPPQSRGNAPEIPPEQLRQALIDEFQVTMNGFDTTHLQWAWEKMWDIYDTEYPSIIKEADGVIIQALPGSTGFSQQIGCDKGKTHVELRQYLPAENFQLLMIHEISHFFQCATLRERAQIAKHQTVYSKEGGASEYGKRGAECSKVQYNTEEEKLRILVNEDYADTLAYYLSPMIGDVPPNCFGVFPSPDNNPYHGTVKKYPEHTSFVQSLLGIYEP